MAKKVRDASLDSRTARLRLKARGKPYYKTLGRGLHIGYRKGKRGGVWVVRRYAGAATYTVETIARADDVADADGRDTLDFWQAQEWAWKLSKSPERPSGPYKVKDAVADYLAELDGRASYHDTKLRLEAYAIPALGAKHVDKLTADVIRHWQRDLVKAPRRVRTKTGAEQRTRSVDLKDPEAVRRRKVSANRVLGQLKAALNFAFTEGKVSSDLEWRRVKPFKDVNRSRASYFTVKQCQRLLNACDAEFRLLVRAALETGCRYGELCRLVVGDFNPDSGTVLVGTSKSGKSRHVNLTTDGQALFAQLTAGQEGSSPMFGRIWRPSEQARPMKEACVRAKINPPVGFHQLRHSFASLAVMNGVPLPVVAQALGHSTTRMAEVHYAHLAPGYVADAIRAGAARFGAIEPSNVKTIR